MQTVSVTESLQRFRIKLYSGTLLETQKVQSPRTWFTLCICCRLQQDISQKYSRCRPIQKSLNSHRLTVRQLLLPSSKQLSARCHYQLPQASRSWLLTVRRSDNWHTVVWM